MRNGDRNDNDELMVYHPYCSFCRKYFYDLEAFKIHLKTEHQFCEICKKDYPNRYYETLEQLKVHYEMTHFVCKFKECESEIPIAFKSQEELDHHIDVKHRGIKKNLNHLIGVSLELEGSLADKFSKKEKKIQIMDKAGCDFTDVVTKIFLKPSFPN